MDIKTSCLGVLALGPASGYEIRKAFEDGPFSHFAEGGFGSIYPALGKLSEEGLVTFTLANQEKRPDKKVYEITELGRARLIDALSAKLPSEDKFKSNFLFLLYFCEEMQRDVVEAALDARIDWYRAKLDHLNGFTAHDGAPLKEEANSQAGSDSQPEDDTRTKHDDTTGPVPYSTDGALLGREMVRRFGVTVYQAAHDFIVQERETFLSLAKEADTRTAKTSEASRGKQSNKDAAPQALNKKAPTADAAE